jgi:TctA family transporter
VTTESRVVGRGAENIRWVARLSGLLTAGLFLLILILAFTNEDEIQAQAVPVVVLLAVAICGVGVAWRWERAGGVMLVASAVALGLSMYQSLPVFGFTGLLMVLLIYALPPLCAGGLFLLSGRRE